MNRSIVEKMHAFIAQRGEQGVTSSELATAFLAPASAPPELCARLIRNVLAGEPRVVERPDGKWAVLRAAGPGLAAAAYAVIEVTGVVTGAAQVPLEWAGVRLDVDGRVSAAAGSAIRPDPWPAGLVVGPPLRGKLVGAPNSAEATAAAAEFARGTTVVSFRTGSFQTAVSGALVKEGSSGMLLSLQGLAKRFLSTPASSAEAVAARLGIPAREPASAAERAAFAAEMLSAMLANRDELGLGEPGGWVEAQHPKRMGVDFSAYEFDREFLEGLPQSPGMYIMREANGQAIYVGKALNLRERVMSYFRARVARDEKIGQILEAISSIDVAETGSELAALLEEYRAIRELQPRINIQFDVHERPAAAKGPHKRMVLVLPSAEVGCAELVLLDGDRAMMRAIVPRDEMESAKAVLSEFFFGGTPATGEPGSDKEELQIAWSWLERNADKVNAFDVDLAADLEGALRLLARYLQEESSGPRVIHV